MVRIFIVATAFATVPRFIGKLFCRPSRTSRNAYAGVSAASVARERFAEAAEAATAAEAQARIGFALGRMDYRTLFDVQRERLVAEVQAPMAVAVAYTSLFRAFGGGWDSVSAPQG